MKKKSVPRRKRGLLGMFLLILFTAALALPIQGCQQQFSPTVGHRAADFSGRDLNGNEISLSDFRDTVVLLVFWTTWCPGCLEELPYTHQIYNAYREKGFQVIGINLNADRSDLEAFLGMIRIEWPQIFDGKGEIAAIYNIGPLPATFLLDRNGIIRYTSLHGKVELERAVRDLLGLPLEPAVGQ